MTVVEDQVALQATWQRLIDRAPKSSQIDWLSAQTGEPFRRVDWVRRVRNEVAHSRSVGSVDPAELRRALSVALRMEQALTSRGFRPGAWSQPGPTQAARSRPGAQRGTWPPPRGERPPAEETAWERAHREVRRDVRELRRRAGEVSTDRLVTLSPILGFLALLSVLTTDSLALLGTSAGLIVGIWAFRRLSAERRGLPRQTARTALALSGAVPGALLILIFVMHFVIA